MEAFADIIVRALFSARDSIIDRREGRAIILQKIDPGIAVNLANAQEAEREYHRRGSDENAKYKPLALTDEATDELNRIAALLERKPNMAGGKCRCCTCYPLMV